MRRHLVPIAAALCVLADPAAAQLAPADRDTLIREAQRAADAAVKAADAAQQAAAAAQRAAAAVIAATGGTYTPPAPSGPPSQVVTASTTPTPTSTRPTTLIPDPPTASKIARGMLASSIANGPNDRSLKSSLTPDFQLVASDKDKVASLAWTIDVTGQSWDEETGQPRGNLSADQFTLTASSKLNGEGEASVLGLKGFTSGTEIKLTYIHYGSKIKLDGLEKPQVAVARERCLAKKPEKPETCDPYKYPTGVGAFVVEYNKEGYGALINEVLPGPMWFYGIDFTGNQTSYEYLDRIAFALKKDKRFGYGGSIFGGLIFNNGSTAIEAGFTWRRDDEAQDPVEICQPIPATIQTQCLTGADGLPVRSSKAIASFSLRHAFAVDPGENWSLAVGPEVSADFKNKSWSVDVPLYFAPNAQGKLRGGFRAIYLNEPKAGGGRQDGVTVSLFIGVPFSLFHR